MIFHFTEHLQQNPFYVLKPSQSQGFYNGQMFSRPRVPPTVMTSVYISLCLSISKDNSKAETLSIPAKFWALKKQIIKSSKSLYSSVASAYAAHVYQGLFTQHFNVFRAIVSDAVLILRFQWAQSDSKGTVESCKVERDWFLHHYTICIWN